MKILESKFGQYGLLVVAAACILLVFFSFLNPGSKVVIFGYEFSYQRSQQNPSDFAPTIDQQTDNSDVWINSAQLAIDSTPARCEETRNLIATEALNFLKDQGSTTDKLEIRDQDTVIYIAGKLDEYIMGLRCFSANDTNILVAYVASSSKFRTGTQFNEIYEFLKR